MSTKNKQFADKYVGMLAINKEAAKKVLNAFFIEIETKNLVLKQIINDKVCAKRCRADNNRDQADCGECYIYKYIED